MDDVVSPSYADDGMGRGHEAPSRRIEPQGVARPGVAGPGEGSDADACQGAAASTIERGARFLWPDLDAPYYADPAAAVERLALKGWCQGRMTPDAPVVHASVAGRYLAADVTYLRTLLGQIEPLEGIAGYARAVRIAPDFADAPRALAMIGLASLAQGLIPEAQTAFERALRDHPGNRYSGVARLGRAAALRGRGRLEEARQVLATIADPVPRGLRCDLLAERAALARAATRFADAVAIDEHLGRDCPELDALPGTIVTRADSLLALGRREEARELLLRPLPSLAVEAQAGVLVRAADLARDDGVLGDARAALDRTLGLRIAAATRATVEARLARLDAVVDLARAQGRLETLAATAPTPASRREVQGILAATLADAGRFGAALRGLASAPEASSDIVLTHRDGVLARWIASLAATDDDPGVASVYAHHRTAIDTRATSLTARQVARALTRVGLAEPALRLLRLRDPGDDPEIGLETRAGPANEVSLASLARSDEPILQRAVMLLDATRGLHAMPEAATGGESPHGR